ncbi:hypothetical protein CORC01_07138 [Colletotrichum orchidophilum]|uniref:Uncharacterized protein n=1 Tax=Colletotrichum orchidophilum TaxID=1209926 RepID=A0A1G4B891_9PEZI|nr:uncharacterized protein CORC01_07138 [Colletotrichum orchidophilum]OHE97523.1 hypothetical protein CORC01_07138 [Colletotrichum orchidophilum]
MQQQQQQQQQQGRSKHSGAASDLQLSYLSVDVVLVSRSTSLGAAIDDSKDQATDKLLPGAARMVSGQGMNMGEIRHRNNQARPVRPFRPFRPVVDIY